MSVTTEKSKQTYISLGEDTFSIDFPFQNPTDIKVFSMKKNTLVETILVEGEDYNINLFNQPNKANIKLTANGLEKTPKGTILTIMRRPAITQETIFTENDPFYVSTIENMADKLTYIAIMLKDDLQRSIKYPLGLDRKPDFSELAIAIEKAYNAAQKADEATIKADEAVQYVKQSVTDAQSQAQKAMKWATNPENEPVEDGKYSAYHYAMKVRDADDYATIDDALAGQSDKKAMSPLATKTAVLYFTGPDYDRYELKSWQDIHKADQNGFLLCECSIGKVSVGANIVLEVSKNDNLSNSFAVLNADSFNATIFQSYMIPIAKGYSYRATGAPSTSNLYFIPAIGEV